jgi:predicted ester cyclase
METRSDHHAVLERWLDMVRSGDMSEIASVWSPEFVIHGSLGDASGYDRVAEAFGRFRTAFPDLQLHVVHMFGQGDRLAGFYRLTATHSAPFLGIEATRRPLAFNASAVYRFAEGRLVEAWAMDDVLAILNQLGVLPFETRGEEDRDA